MTVTVSPSRVGQVWEQRLFPGTPEEVRVVWLVLAYDRDSGIGEDAWRCVALADSDGPEHDLRDARFYESEFAAGLELGDRGTLVSLARVT